LPLYKGEPAQPVTFDQPGIVKLGCNIHDWMRGTIFVLPTPYFAKTDGSGKAQLKLPPGGPWTLAATHERLADSVDKTHRHLASGTTSISWKLNLKPSLHKRRSAFEYR
jgi:hypothetical protein